MNVFRSRIAAASRVWVDNIVIRLGNNCIQLMTFIILVFTIIRKQSWMIL